MTIGCKACDYNKNSKDGICKTQNANDKYAIRCVGKWSKDKYYYLKRYIEIFTASMKNKWAGNLYYIDLFVGPGKCRVRDTQEEIDSSPLIALNTKYPFKKYFFVDLNTSALEPLKKRIGMRKDIVFYNDDCNVVVDKIINDIPVKSLSLAFIDPTGLHFKFSSLQKIAQRKIDLIINFPEGMAIKRNLSKFIKENRELLDQVMGTKEWRKCKNTREIIELYRRQLVTLGYKEVKLGDEIQITSGQNVPLYYLIFACKNDLGHKFWNKIKTVDHNQQMALGI